MGNKPLDMEKNTYTTNMKINALLARRFYDEIHGSGSFDKLIASNTSKAETSISNLISQIESRSNGANYSFGIRIGEILKINMNKYLFGELVKDDIREIHKNELDNSHDEKIPLAKNDFLEELCISSLIAIGVSENGEFDSSYVMHNSKEKTVDYYYDLSKINHEGRYPEFVLLCFNVSSIILSSKLDLESNQVCFKFDYFTSNIFAEKVILEFKYGELKEKCFETVVLLEPWNHKIRIELPNLGNDVYDNLCEICITLRPGMIKEKRGHFKIYNLCFEIIK